MVSDTAIFTIEWVSAYEKCQRCGLLSQGLTLNDKAFEIGIAVIKPYIVAIQ